MSTARKGIVGACVFALMGSVFLLPAAAQDQPGYGPDNAPPPQDQMGPPQGQYAPAPQGTEEGGTYEEQQQEADEAYAQSYDNWAARYCVNQANNTVAGALIGGILGAGIGAAVTRNPATGAAIGGAIGAGSGAVAGASSGGGACPPGYAVAAGAPAFYYATPYYAWAPAWYHPWLWAGGRWVYHPYRYWYWNHRAYWHPGWRYRAWRWHRR